MTAVARGAEGGQGSSCCCCIDFSLICHLLPSCQHLPPGGVCATKPHLQYADSWHNMHSLVRCMPQGMQQATACNTCHTPMSTRTAIRCCIFVLVLHRIDLTYDMSIKPLLQRCVAPTRRAALCGSIVWQHFYCSFLLLTCHKMRSYKTLPSLFLSSKLLAALLLLLLNMQQKLQLQQRRPQHAATTTPTHIILQQFLADADAVPWPGGVPWGGVPGGGGSRH